MVIRISAIAAFIFRRNDAIGTHDKFFAFACPAAVEYGQIRA